MENTYVTKHDWGSYNSDLTINKLLLRNVRDFIDYYKTSLPLTFETVLVNNKLNLIENGENIV